MKYMVVSSAIKGQYEAAIKEWAKPPKPTEGVEPLAGWHVMVDTKSFTKFEADSLVSLAKAVRHWQDLLNIEIYPVVDDKEGRTFLE